MDTSRVLSPDEIQALATRYANGSLLSRRIENELRASAWKAGGELLEISVAAKIVAMHERWKELGLLK